MKETAMKRNGKMTPGITTAGCMVSVKNNIDKLGGDVNPIDVKYKLEKGKIDETIVPPVVI